jgi:hypothetical protein
VLLTSAILAEEIRDTAKTCGFAQPPEKSRKRNKTTIHPPLARQFFM